MFSGPVVSSTPNHPATPRIHTLKRPICGERRKVQDTANRSPGMAMGTRIRPQATLRNGMSVRSVRKAKRVASPTEMAVLNTASRAVLKNMEYVCGSE